MTQSKQGTDVIHIHRFEEPNLTTSFENTIRHFRKFGLEIIPVDGLGTPAQMRELMGFDPQDWVVCSFMASSPMGKMPDLRDLVFSYAFEHGQINKNLPSMRMPLINGGGNGSWLPTYMGLMGQHTHGTASAGQDVLAVITEELIIKEGLPEAAGRVLGLIGKANDPRLGLRTDALIALADAIIVFPGGMGTDTEVFDRLTKTSIDKDKNGLKTIFVNPLVYDKHEGVEVRYFEYLFKKNKLSCQCGGVTERTLRDLNNQMICYNPRKGATADEMKNDLLSILYSIRKLEADPQLRSGLAPLPDVVENSFIRPLSQGSNIAQPYPGYRSSGDWYDRVAGCLSKAPMPRGRLYLPGGLAFG